MSISLAHCMCFRIARLAARSVSRTVGTDY